MNKFLVLSVERIVAITQGRFLFNVSLSSIVKMNQSNRTETSREMPNQNIKKKKSHRAQ